MVVQSAATALAGFFVRWIGRTALSQEVLAVSCFEVGFLSDASVDCANATQIVDTVAKLNSPNRKAWFDMWLIDLRLVCRKSIPILSVYQHSLCRQENPAMRIVPYR